MPSDQLNWSWWGAALLFAAMLFSEDGGVELSHASDDDDGGRYVVSVATIPHIASILLLPPPLAALLAGAGTLVDELRGRCPRQRLVFNVAGTVLSVGTAGIAAPALGVAGDAVNDDSWSRVASFFAVICVYYLVNTLPVVAITTIASGGAFWRLLTINLRHSAPAEFAVAVVGGPVASAHFAPRPTVNRSAQSQGQTDRLARPSRTSVVDSF